MTDLAAWGSDAPPSLPKPLDPDVEKVSMGGFCFTANGIRVDATETELEDHYQAPYQPRQT